MIDQPHQSITFHGQALELLPDRAVWWPAERRLLVADVHLGKDQVFRQRGIAIPDASLDHDLQRLHGLLKQYPGSILTILGDLVHARPEPEAAWVERFKIWLNKIGPERCEVILGNHDRQMSEWLDAWGIAHHRQLSIDSIYLCHDDAGPQQPVICGHLHPAIRLKTRGQRLRLPAFWQRRDALILPAFGRFTGMADIDPCDNDHVYPVQAERVFHLPARKADEG